MLQKIANRSNSLFTFEVTNMKRKLRRKLFALTIAVAALVVAVPSPADAQDGHAGHLHGPKETKLRLTPADPEMDDSQVQSEEWTFFAEPTRSSLDFQPENQTGEFSITIHGVAPTEPLIPDLTSAPKTNDFSLAVHGRIVDTITGDVDTDISILEDVTGRLVLSNADGSWQVDMQQENFSIMAATLQLTPGEQRVRGYFPVIMKHSESATEVHAQLYVLFTEDTAKKGREVTVVLKQTRDDLARLGHTAKLADLLGSEPVDGGPVRTSIVSEVGSTVIKLGSASGKPLGRIGNAEAIESILCAENREMVQCDEDQRAARAIDLQLSGVPIREDGLGSIAWNLDLLLYPAASVEQPDGVIATYFEKYSGALQVGSAVYEANQMLVGSTIGMSVYDTADRSIQLTLPLGIGSESDPVARTVVSATCSLEGDTFMCDYVEISEASGSSGHPVGERPIGKLSSGVVISDMHSLELVKAIDANKQDLGCQFLCPICVGRTSDCGASGHLACGLVTSLGCYEQTVPPRVWNSCCQGNFRAACRDCSVTVICPLSTSTATKVVPLDTAFGKAEGAGIPDLQEDASCEPIVLSRSHTFPSGLEVLKDDWTLFGVDKSGSLQATGTSRAGHAHSRKQCISDRPSGTYLVIDHIPHVMNDRYIPTPDVRLEPSKLSGFDSGRIVVLFEYDDQGEFVQAELIYSSFDVSSADLTELQEALELGYHSQDRHPLSVYAFLEFSDDEKAQLVQDFLVTTAKCCQL